MNTELDKRIQARLEKIVGSGWSIKSFKNICLTTYAQTPTKQRVELHPNPRVFQQFQVLDSQYTK